MFQNLSRVPPPEVGPSQFSAAEVWGGQFEWCWGVPLILRAISSPHSGTAVPALPVSRTPKPDSLGYWTPLQYLLTFSLGWPRHDRGLRNWYDAGKPTTSPALALISALWGADRTLDAYVWWCHQPTGITAGNAVIPQHFTVHDHDRLAPEWQEKLRAFEADARNRHPSPGGAPQPDGFHLEQGSHIEAANSSHGSDPARLTVKDLLARTAVFEASNLNGWYRQLAEAGATLTHDQIKSWHVDVYVQNVGYLGVYRRSWKSGLWFSGPHRFHEMGL